MWARDMEERETQTDKSFCAGSSVTNNAFTFPTAVVAGMNPLTCICPMVTGRILLTT